MIQLRNSADRHNLKYWTLGDELPDETWEFPECEVIRIGDRIAVLMIDHVGPHGSIFNTEIRAVELLPRKGVDELIEKLDDGADPTIYDVADPGIVTWDIGVHVTYLYGGMI